MEEECGGCQLKDEEISELKDTVASLKLEKEELEDRMYLLECKIEKNEKIGEKIANLANQLY